MCQYANLRCTYRTTISAVCVYVCVHYVVVLTLCLWHNVMLF